MEILTFKWENGDTEYNAIIEPRKQIRIFGKEGGFKVGVKAFDKVIKIGDQAEYDSWNLTYYGPVVSIGAKTVTVSGCSTGKDNKRLKLIDFIRKNAFFDLDKVKAGNSDTMYYI